MKFSPTLLAAAIDYERARDAYFDLDPDNAQVAVTEECEKAREKYVHTGMLLAELALGEIHGVQ